MKYVVCNGQARKRLKIVLVLILISQMILNNTTYVKASSNRQYLDITLADIIIAWYNASGVAIGNSELANEIYNVYGNITLEELVDNGVIVTNDLTATKEDIKDAIGYGSASVPYLKINTSKFYQLYGNLTLSQNAEKAIKAMFSWDGNSTMEGIFQALGIVVGNVVNLGKIGYNVLKDVVVDTISNFPLIGTLRDVYHHFTDSTYFQDLINESVDTGDEYIWYDNAQYRSTVTNEIIPPTFTYENINNLLPGDVRDRESVIDGNYFSYARKAVDYTKYGKIVYRKNNISQCMIVNLDRNNHIQYVIYGLGVTAYPLLITPSSVIDHDTETYYEVVTGSSTRNFTVPLGCVLLVDASSMSEQQIAEYCIEHWKRSGSSGSTATTDYINNEVGNISSTNYLDLDSNIKTNEYMYIFDKNEYLTVLNQIQNNTNNGDYIDNSTVINTYNTTYIQEPTEVVVRPSMVPAPSEQPAQPFISPRPTPLPEETEEAIYNGGIAESIKDKFPFCIPWDIQALVNGLWSSNRQAPYIHWDARFGNWGKLGEVNIDLSPFDTAAAIFRSTTLLLWIIGLVLITRNLIGS